LAVADGVVYAGHAKGTCAVRAVDGKILWQNKAWDGGEGTTSTFTVGAGVLVASAHWNGLFGHDISNGALLWKKCDSKIRFRDGSATFYDGNFYLASCENLYVINPRSGDILKMAETSYEFNSACAPLVTDKYLIVSTSNKGVVAFDRLTFKEVWNYRTGTSLFYTVPYSHNQECTVEVSPVLVGSAVLFGASDGYLHAVDLNTGAYRGKRALGAPVFSSVAVSGNCLFVADFGGNIYNFKLHN
jgi:outer membrane protein assembly factor BamB